MKAPSILSTAVVVAGSLVIGQPVAAQAGTGMVTPALYRPAPGLMLVQSAQGWPGDRMMRLRQHRSIIEDALRPPQRRMPAEPAEPVEPQARPLQPPEPMVRAAPQEPRPDPAAEAQGRVSCEEAAGIIAEFGFSDVRRGDCSGDLYRFSATRDGTAYSIGITASAGEIVEVSRE